MLDLPGYTIEQTLHSSQSSAVFRAVRDIDGAAVVLKFPQAMPVPARQLTRYRNEFDILGHLDSSRIVKALDLIRHAHSLALVLEAFDGVPLAAWLRSKGPALGERLAAAIQATDALCDVHAAGIIHKDVNSHNLLIDPQTQSLKLIDFGIASRLRSERSGFQAPASLEGTLAYIAPEQTGRMNHSIDQRADLYSLGVTLFELFSGRMPHLSDDPLELVHFHIAGKPPRLNEVDEKVPAQIAAIVAKLLQKSPEDRYQSAVGLKADLEICRRQLEETGSIVEFAPGSHERVNRFHLPERLYGRDAEIRRLTDAFDRAAGGGVEVVQIAGDPGIGKTSLVRELYASVTQRRGYFCAGKFDQLRRNAPFSALVDALQGLVAQLLTESEERLAIWREKILNAAGNNGRLILDVIPTLESIIGDQPAVPELPGAEARNRFENTFRRFLQVFASREHPLVIFVDDAQWADAASLTLSNLLVCAQDTEALLMIQAFRSNEVSAGHPLTNATRFLQDQGKQPARIELGPLQAEDIRQLIADSLHRPAEATTNLATIVQQKTGGNAFFVGQFLQSLHEAGHISFSADTQAFDFDLAAISESAITDNVASLLTRRLSDLPAETLDLLQIAAAIGRRFDIETIARQRNLSESAVAGHLQPAVAAEVIVPVSRLESLRSSDAEASLGYRQMQFLHDRLQQATYESIDGKRLARIHLDIGRTRLADTAALLDDRDLFEVVGHMNRGMHLIDDPAERIELAKLNLQANTRARKSTAYPLAIDCCEKALTLLGGEESWQHEPQLAFELHAELAEALTLDARHEQALEVLRAAQSHANEPLESARLYALQIGSYLGIGDMPGALAVGHTALSELGIQLPEDADEIEAALQRDIGEVLRRTDELGLEQLLELPRMQSPLEMTLMELMAHCMPAAYQTNKQLFSLICSRMVLLSLDGGHCPLSARAYTSFGALLSGVLSDYTRAFQFTQLAIALAGKLDDPTVLAGVYMVHGLFVSHWNEPIDASIAAFQHSFEFGVQHGDHVHAAYAIARKICYQQARGAPLEQLRADAIATLSLIRGFGDLANVAFVEARVALMDWLIEGGSQNLDTAAISEKQRISEAFDRGNFSFVSDLMIVLSSQRALAGSWSEALEMLRESEKHIAFSSAFATQVEHSFFYAITAAALLSDPNCEQRDELIEALDSNLERLRLWSGQCEANYGHMYLLAAAEHARVSDQPLEALRLYDAAIASAAHNGFANIEAIAAECAAEFWSQRGKPEFSRIYLEKSLAALETWGAHGKARLLRERFGLNPTRRGNSITISTTVAGQNEQRHALDFATVLKATQMLASEIRLDRLIASMIDIVLEHVGGERAVLVLGNSGAFFVQGLRDSIDASTHVMLDKPLADATTLSRGIAHFVIRTKEHVVLENPASKGTFRNDAYISERKPKSVLCSPINYKGELRGLIYLENNQIAGAFTPQHLETLNLLMAQIGVSVENAMLYSSQEQQARRIEKANADLATEVTERKAAEAELSRYKDHLEELVRRRTEELENAQGRLVEMSRRSGMAEVAAGVLHNVGNVMNSINVGAHVARDAVRDLKIEQIAKVCDQLDLNAERIGEYLTNDPGGRKIPEYLRRLHDVLAKRKSEIHTELSRLLEHLEHMKRVIAAQQTYAKTGGVEELCTLDSIIDTALAISEANLRSSKIEVSTDCAEMPSASFDRHRILQIVINLISNARHAVQGNAEDDRRMEVRIGQTDSQYFVEVEDNGVGIPAENLSRIFNHGFTTKKEGHGFGLHNCANSARDMGGSLQAFSAGIGRGARFVLRLPARESAEEVVEAGAA